MKKICLILILTTLTACTTIRENTTALNGAVADTVTTTIALTKSNVVEANPIGFPMTIVLKAMTVAYLKINPNELNSEDVKQLDHAAGSIWLGAAANNLAVILGVVNPIALTIGITTGIALYLNKD